MESTTEEEKDLVKDVYEAAVKVKNPVHETEITKRMATKLGTIASKTGNFSAKEEIHLELGKGKNKDPRIDITFGQEGTEEKALMGFVEVGCLKASTAESSEPESLDNLFWHKVHQMDNYLAHLRDDTVSLEEFTFQPDCSLLLCVLVTNRSWTMGRLAVFVCEPKMEPDKDWRIAMLWRREIKGKEAISEAFGGYVAALRYLAELDESHSKELGEEWHYLGPNCSKVTLSNMSSQLVRLQFNEKCPR